MELWRAGGSGLSSWRPAYAAGTNGVKTASCQSGGKALGAARFRARSKGRRQLHASNWHCSAIALAICWESTGRQEDGNHGGDREAEQEKFLC